MEENRTEEMKNGAAAGGTREAGADAAAPEVPEEKDLIEAAEEIGSEREAYEELIKTRFRELYAEDTQKLINRRFRKYKVMEERYRVLEEKLAVKEQELAERDRQLEVLRTEAERRIEHAVKAAEADMVRSLRAKQSRPVENGLEVDKYSLRSAFSAASLTREEREQMARRAFNGEMVSF